MLGDEEWTRRAEVALESPRCLEFVTADMLESATMITLWPLCARPGCLCFVPQRGQTCRWCHERFQRSTEAIFAKWDELFRRLAK